MFFGTYEYSADPKGRVSIPTKLRIELGETLYVTKGLDRSLFIFPSETFERYAKSLMAGAITSPINRGFSRQFLSGASELQMDKQGRVLIPQYLREFAGIDKDLYVMGMGDRVEIWAKDQWDSYIAREELNYDNLAANLQDPGTKDDI